MSALLELAEAVQLHRAETHWLDQCSARLRRATLERNDAQPTETTQAER